MAKKWNYLLPILITVMLVGGIISANNKAFAAEPILIKFNAAIPKSPPSLQVASLVIANLAKKLEKNSEGRFKVDVYWGASLYKDDPTQHAALRSNTIQMCETAGGRLGGVIRESFLLELPFVFDSMEHADRFTDGPARKLFRPLYLKHGYQLMGHWGIGLQNYISSKRFLAEPKDYVGIKLRIRPSKLVSDTVKALGASGHVIPYMDTYNALLMGTADGAECPLSIIQGVKWHETGNYMTLSRHSLLFMAMLVNPTFYNKLPADLKKVFDDTFEEATRDCHEITKITEQRMPWIMMSENPSLRFKWLTDKERLVLRDKVEVVWKDYKKQIPKEFFDAVEETRTK